MLFSLTKYDVWVIGIPNTTLAVKRLSPMLSKTSNTVYHSPSDFNDATVIANVEGTVERIND